MVRSERYVRLFIYSIVVILINVIGVTLFFRMDLTENRIYSISRASKRAVSTLSEPLTIHVFFTRNLPAPYNNTERYLRDLLEEYSIYADRRFNYRFYDVSPEEGDISKEARRNQELARSYGIHPVQIQVIERDEVKLRQAYMGLVMIHGDLIERIPTITATEGLEYNLTTAIRKLNDKISALLRLEDKIKVNLVFSSSLKAVAPYIRLDELPELPLKIKEIVEKINSRNYGRLEFEHLDPATDPSLGAGLAKYRILKLKWPELSDGKIPAGEGAVGLVMEHGEKKKEIQLVRAIRIPIIGTQYEMVDMDQLEEIIDKSAESLIDIHEDLGLLAGHGTLRIYETPGPGIEKEGRNEILANFRNLLSRSYTLKEVDLKKGPVPAGMNCLIIAGPKEPFDDYELFQIDQFLMQGKSLAVFLDAFKEISPPGGQPRGFQRPSVVPSETGLERLLRHYGVNIKPSYVLDENCYRQRMPIQYGGGERAVYFAPIIKDARIDKSLNFMRGIKGLVVLKVSPLELNRDRLKGEEISARRLFSSSEKSWEMSGRINLNPLFIQPPGNPDEQGSLALAYLLEGRFPSYFAGKPIPEKRPEAGTATNGTEDEGTKPENKKEGMDLAGIQGEGTIMEKGHPGRIFLISSSELLKDNMLDENGETPNATFILNLIDYLNNREDIALMRSKELRFNPLKDTAPGIRAFTKYFNIAGLPALVILFGLIVWLRRHSRKKRIRMMFLNS